MHPESPPTAIRIGFANPFNLTTRIASCSVWSSSSWSDCDLEYARPSSDLSIFPTGGAVERKFYFAFGGSDNSQVNNGAGGFATTRSFVLPPNVAGGVNAAAGYTMRWTDWAPAPAALTRIDGGVQPIYFFYVTLAEGGASTVSSPSNSSLAHYNSAAVASQGRFMYAARAWTTGTDYADNPRGTRWTGNGRRMPIVAIQYIPQKPGVQIALNGDSLTCAPTPDAMSSPLLRAAMSLSTPALPFEVANMGWWGTPSRVYIPVLRNNAEAIKPSIFVPQLISRNDGSTSVAMREVIRKHLISLDSLQRNGATRCQLIWNSCGCEPSYDRNSDATSCFVAIRNAMNAAAAAGGPPVIDAPSVVGNVPSAPWDYLLGMSDDNSHPNYMGAAAITPLALAALKQVL